MVKPNYQFDKRQRDLQKKRKQEEKRERKLAQKNSAGADVPENTGATPDSKEPDPPQGGPAQ